jgi:hypothetical protein
MEGIMKTLFKQSSIVLAIAAACIAIPALAMTLDDELPQDTGFPDNGGSSLDGGSYFAGGDPSKGVTVIGSKCPPGWVCYSWLIPGTSLPIWEMVSPTDRDGGGNTGPTDPNCISNCNNKHTIAVNNCNIDGENLRLSLTQAADPNKHPFPVLLGGFYRWAKQGTPFEDLETPPGAALSQAQIATRVSNFKSFCTATADITQNLCYQQTCHAMLGLLGLLIPASWVRRRRAAAQT